MENRVYIDFCYLSLPDISILSQNVPNLMLIDKIKNKCEWWNKLAGI